MAATKYKDSGIPWIGMIPSDWEVVKLKQIVQCLDSRRVPIDAGDRIKGSYPYWGAGSIVDYVDNYIFDEELILLGEDGAPFFDKTRPVAFLVKERIWVNNHIHVLKTIRDCASYITYCLNTVDYTHYINGSILNKLTQSNMNKIVILLPPLPTQKRIADFLDRKCAEIDELAALQETVIAELKSYKQSVITEAVTKGLDPNVPMKDSGVKWIGEIPEGWDVRQIKRYAKVNNGKEIIVELPANTPNAKPVYGSGGIFKYTNDILFNGEAVLFGRKGTLGKPLYVNGEFWVVDTMYYLTFDSALFPKYAYYELMAFDWIPFITHTAIPSVVASDVVASNVPIPPITEQRAIADYLDKKCAEIDELIAIKQQKIEALKEYKKSVIFEYVTGKKEVGK